MIGGAPGGRAGAGADGAVRGRSTNSSSTAGFIADSMRSSRFTIAFKLSLIERNCSIICAASWSCISASCRQLITGGEQALQDIRNLEYGPILNGGSVGSEARECRGLE
jgi:hypothetical protein